APCFVFVDEIDAIAGRHARHDPRRRATFEALIAQLDGEFGQIFKVHSAGKQLAEDVDFGKYIEETEELATEELAMNGLRNNRHILDMITEELLDKSRITGLGGYRD
ncbi:hypothetical protein ABKV19_017366, partial [Rosa sericea]